MPIDPIANGEGGASVRAKINAGLDAANIAAVESALPNLYDNGALANGAQDVKLYVPDYYAYGTVRARFASLVDAYLNALGCTTALAVLAADGGAGNLVAAETGPLTGGYMLASCYVKSSDGNWNFGTSTGLVAILRFTDDTAQNIYLSAAPGAYESPATNVRRYYAVAALTAGKTLKRIEMGVNANVARTSDFWVTGFWASWSRAPVVTERTAHPNWRASVRPRRWPEVSAAVTAMEPRLAAVEARTVTSAIDDLRAAIHDDTRSLKLVLIGDSNTWGMSATGIAATTPREHALSDVRNNLMSPTWANLLRKWLGYKIASGNGLTEPQPGSGRYVDPVMVDPTRHPAFGVYTTATGAKVTTPAITDPRAGAAIGKSLDILGGQELRFTFAGDQFAVRFAKMATDAGATFSVYIDGAAAVSNISHYQAPAAFGFSQVVTTTFGRHDVRIVNNSTTQFLRLEAIEHYRSVEVINQGLIGTTSTEWLPTGSLLANAVPAGTTHVMIMLGTNDRHDGTAPTQPTKTADNVEAIVAWLIANRPGVQCVVYAPPVARGVSEQGGGATTYYYTAAEVGRALGDMCRRTGYAFADYNGWLKCRELAGDAILVSDDLHLSDVGHFARFEYDVRMLTAAR